MTEYPTEQLNNLYQHLTFKELEPEDNLYEKLFLAMLQTFDDAEPNGVNQGMNFEIPDLYDENLRNCLYCPQQYRDIEAGALDGPAVNLEENLESLQDRTTVEDLKEICSICLSDIDLDDRVHTKCNHWFHQSCLQLHQKMTRWDAGSHVKDTNGNVVKMGDLCPMCRRPHGIST